MSLEIVEQASLLAVVLGFTFGNAPALYVTALIANICQAGFIFVRFVGSTFHHENQLIETWAGGSPADARVPRPSEPHS